MIDSLEVQVLYPARWRRRGTPSVQLQRRWCRSLVARPI